ncbi:protein ENHANCED DISEASE RESISTANCE 2-like [Impatiens glandulifera]|uniref:protein ENHANCED DISEASE RESISTANCE 2-like n=1 Tax=Impatiens glandulifera TaxID=253017 RepID=UPI001FB11D45|nr:protein ENHANCED DISEASE RESISTANCE 2-like [Impatiens glandulifera]
MGISNRMEGWLYLIRLNRLGLQYSRKRYFILEKSCLKNFKSKPKINAQVPLRCAVIDSCIRVTDCGRESYHRKVLFIFTLYNNSDQNDQLKFGATSPEEAARWIHSLQNVAFTAEQSSVACTPMHAQPFRLSFSKKAIHQNCYHRTHSSFVNMDAITSDVIAPSSWKIFGCENGLRLFTEAKDVHSSGVSWGENPAIMAVGIVPGSSEAVFQTIMSLGPERLEWDFFFHKGNVIERLDGHTDIVHVMLHCDSLPWGMRQRDLLYRRYWRREDDGSYVILYHSVYHKNCPPQPGYVRATVKSGGYVISPANQGKESVVKHMLSIDWRLWRSYIRKAPARDVTISMLGRIAALRELFRAKTGLFSSGYLSSKHASDNDLPQLEKEEIKSEIENAQKLIKVEEEDSFEDEHNNACVATSSLMGLHDMGDEFFDVPGPSADEKPENEWSSDLSPDRHYPDKQQPQLSSATVLVKKWHGLAVQKKGYMELQEASREENRASFCYGTTLAKDGSCNSPCSWTTADPSSFLIRGNSYLQDRQKVKAKGCMMQIVGADWLRSDKREDNLGGRTGGIVQKSAEQGKPDFFLIINFQVPGATSHNLALYFMIKTPLEEIPLLEQFVNGDDAYRASRFKLIPYISEGSWIVKQSVGKKACLVGQALKVNFIRGKNYLELDIDAGSSTVARGVVNLVLGYLNNLVIELAFLIQANTQDELPEALLGACRLNHLNISKAVLAEK